ncbi:MAG TPA: hypothetical protein VGL91_22455 [Acidobacteriota bacterium]|jgi:hypothetical protein
MLKFKRLSRSKHIPILIVAAFLAFVVFGVSGGCGAYRRPPVLNAEERAMLQTGPLPYSVTVALVGRDEARDTGQNPEAYGDALAKLVTASGTFKTIRYERSSTPSGQDLVATSTGLYCNTAVIPVLSIVSLGVIPTVFQDEQCQGMLLRRAAGRPKSEGVQVEVRYKGPVIMGWIAVVVGALPGWSHGSVDGDSRFAARFRLAVIRRHADIERLVGR